MPENLDAAARAEIRHNSHMDNLLKNLPTDLPEELFETLVQSETVHVERIVSRGHVSPAGDWYDQERNEFVLLLQGAARLEFKEGYEVELEPGDWLGIPAHRKHRVAWTDPDQPTIWLAVHYE
ncbi:MAG: cupin domain-containing protein [Lysobacterales bacterium]